MISYLEHLFFRMLIHTDLRNTITGEGVWRIRHKKKGPVIEIFKVEESGHGSILSQSFKDWRQKALAKEIAGLL